MASNKKKTDEKAMREVDDAAIMKMFKKLDLNAFVAECVRKASAWKNTTLYIGVIGPSGSGKSTFVNTIRRIKANDPGAASANVVEETREPTPYQHPQNVNVKMWDLPGFNTRKFPREKYKEKINFKRYDFFIIISSSRFTEDDEWISKEVLRDSKRFIYVRTKIDDDIRHDKDDYPQTHSEAEVLRKVRESCTAGLIKGESTEHSVFLVSKNPALYDFPELEARIIADLPELQREAAVLTLRSASKKVIEAKTYRLQKRVWLEASICVAFNSRLIERLSIHLNTGKLSELIMQYKKVYGLDKEGIKDISGTASLSEHELLDMLKEYFWLDFTEDSLIDVMEQFFSHKQASSVPHWPLVGVLSNFGTSKDATKLFLEHTLQSMQRAMLSVLEAAYATAAPK